MAVETLGNLLDRAAKFERRVGRCYADIRDSSHDNDVRLLTYFLARQHRHQEQGMVGLDPAQKQHIRAIEIEHDIRFTPEKIFSFLKRPPEKTTGVMLLKAAIAYGTQLTELYERILQQAPIHEARDVLKTLIRLKKRDIDMMKKTIAMHYF